MSFQIALVREGLGVALAAGSNPAVQHADGLRAVALTPSPSYEKVRIWRRSNVPNPALQALLQIWVQRVR